MILGVCFKHAEIIAIYVHCPFVFLPLLFVTQLDSFFVVLLVAIFDTISLLSWYDVKYNNWS